MKYSQSILICLVFFIFLIGCKSKDSDLKRKLNYDISKLIENKKLDIGVSIKDYSGDELISINGNKNYKLYSVCKFFLALYILNKVDEGKLNLNQKITFSKKDLKPDLFSPLRDSISQGTDLTLNQSIKFMIKESDNNVFDKLVNVSGGFAGLNSFIHKTFTVSQEEFRIMYDYTSSKVDFESNVITPNLATKILYQLENKKILSNKSYNLLKYYMEDSINNSRIQGLIINKTKSFHKAGTSNRENGILSACNDIGIVNLKDGKSFSIAVFISNSQEDDTTNNDLIAKITELTYNKLNH